MNLVPPPTLAHLWDSLFVEGNGAILLCFCLALIERLQPALVECEGLPTAMVILPKNTVQGYDTGSRVITYRGFGYLFAGDPGRRSALV